MAKIETTVLAVKDLASSAERFAGCDDPHRLLDFSPCKLKTYVSNPFLPSLDAPCRLIGVKDGTVVGCRNSFPGRFVADGTVHDNRISGSVYVDSRCRSSLYAIKMLQKALTFPGGEVNINCWMSRQNQKFYHLLGSCMIRFEVFDTGGRWSRYLQKVTSPRWRAFAAFFANRIAAFANAFLDGRRWRGLPDWTVEVTESPDDAMLEEACGFVRRDPHRYRQEITPAWIRWTLEHDFKESRRKSFVRVCENGSPVGFALVRMDDRAKFGKVYEWQVAPAFRGGGGEVPRHRRAEIPEIRIPHGGCRRRGRRRPCREPAPEVSDDTRELCRDHDCRGVCLQRLPRHQGFQELARPSRHGRCLSLVSGSDA